MWYSMLQASEGLVPSGGAATARAAQSFPCSQLQQAEEVRRQLCLEVSGVRRCGDALQQLAALLRQVWTFCEQSPAHRGRAGVNTTFSTPAAVPPADPRSWWLLGHSSSSSTSRHDAAVALVLCPTLGLHLSSS